MQYLANSRKDNMKKDKPSEGLSKADSISIKRFDRLVVLQDDKSGDIVTLTIDNEDTLNEHGVELANLTTSQFINLCHVIINNNEQVDTHELSLAKSTITKLVRC